MLGKIASFEFRYHLLSPPFIWISAILLLFTFGIAASDQIQLGSSNAVHANSPQAISMNLMIFSFFGMVFPVVFLASGILRDRNFGTHELFYTTPVNERAYLVGRFIGGFIITCLVIAMVPIGNAIGSAMPWVDPESIGPFNIVYYAYPYLVLGIANMLIIGMIVFTVANLSRSLLITWVSLLGLFVLNTIAGVLYEEVIEWREISALTDPFGSVALAFMTQYWTAAEQNTQLVPMDGVFLQNRLIWIGIAIVLFIINVLIFSFRQGNARFGTKKAQRALAPFVPARIELPKTQPTPEKAVMKQFLARIGFEVKGVVFNIAFWVLLFLGVALVGFSVFLIQPFYGTPNFPLTRLVYQSMAGSFLLVPIIIVIYYASELIWRERSVRFSDIVDATPTPSWVFMTAKLVGMFVVIVGLMSVALLIAIGSQLVRGYTDVELDQYLIRSLFEIVYPLMLLSMLAIFLQVITNNKWLGIAAIGVVFIFTAFVLNNIGLNHNLYQFPFVAIGPYSDMNEYGHFLGIQAWYHLYWGGVTLFLFLIAAVMFNRGALAPLWQRLLALPRAFNAPTAAMAGLALAIAIGSGSWIFYNTTVLNEYQSSRDGERLAADFEREWRGQLEDLPQPTITDVEYTIDIFPNERRYTVSGTNMLENRTDTDIPVIWVSYGSADVIEQSLEGDTAEMRSEFAELYAFELQTPLAPGERRELSFQVEVTNPGFRNSGNNSSVRYNGTFFNNGEFAPIIGFSRNVLIQDPPTRRRLDLPELERAFPLEDESRWSENYIRQDSDYVTFRTVVSTVEGQTVVAPGYLQSMWSENGRTYFEYVMEDRSLNFFNFMSADYELAEEEVDGVNYQVFYHEPHEWNVQRMLEASQDSITYFSEAFSPYQYRQYRTLQFPYGGFAQSFPNTIAYSENIGFTANLSDPDNIDYVYYITAHEAAHQWWAHQVMGPNVQGGAMLVETFAQYAALMVMKQEYGEDHMRRFLKYELDQYLQGRGNETRAELPLYRVENQGYIHYRKGAVIMYALQDYIGEETVNRAMRRLIQEFQYQHAPYPTTLDFLRLLREEAGPEHDQLITDFFERIMIFDLSVETDDADLAPQRRELEGGRWETTFTVNARLFEADGEGNETEEPIAYDIDIGVFTDSPDSVNEGTDHILHFERVRIDQAQMTFTIVTDVEPTVVGIDPYNKLIDRNSDDNLAGTDRVRQDGENEGEAEAEPSEGETETAALEF
ncbi:ABC transporter permease/M1 family aminopeptidase [Hyphobacterium sp.]|uniref:ABC transporter permease/M1 family aminopeptidase n=1 Tax=Hyphobacterium sp. TaxID=2004662 RepID=UPI003BA9ACDD